MHTEFLINQIGLIGQVINNIYLQGGPKNGLFLSANNLSCKQRTHCVLYMKLYHFYTKQKIVEILNLIVK